MSESVLIATHNEDKYNTIKIIIQNIHQARFEFVSLKDLHIDTEMDESGDVLQTAEAKAVFYNDICMEKNCKIDYVVGVDDGFDKSEQGLGDSNSYNITDQILAGEYVSKGQIVWVKRGVATVHKEKLNSGLVNIPYTFNGNPDNVKREKGKFALSKVFVPIGGDKVVTDTSAEDLIKYYSKYHKNVILEVFGEK